MCIRLRALLGVALVATYSMAAIAANIVATVADPSGRPVSNVVVFATATAGMPANASRTENAVMDQIDKEFVPEVLVVRTGTSVVFPNSDSVAHQVYSFSP